MTSKNLSRRRLLTAASVGAGSVAAMAALVGCGEVQTVTERVVEVVTKEVPVEKVVTREVVKEVAVEVEKVVTQQVEVAVEVEKVVEKTVVEERVVTKVVQGEAMQRKIETVTFWDFETRALGVAAQEAWLARAGTHAAVRVERLRVPFPEMEPKVLAGKASGTLPDMVWSQPDSCWTWAAAEIVAPLDEVHAEIGVNKFGNNPLEATKLDGVSYGIPQFLWPHIMYYRMDKYEENGFDEPKTWIDLGENGAALNNPPDHYGFFTYLKDAHPKLAWNLMPAFDAYVFDRDGSVALGSQGTLGSLILAAALFSISPPGVAGNDEGAGRTAFLNGLASHMTSSTSFSTGLAAAPDDLLSKVGAVAQPSVIGDAAGLAGMNILNITTGTKHPDRMMELFVSLFDHEIYQGWFISTVLGWAPTLRSVQEGTDYWENARVKPVARLVRTGVEASNKAWPSGAKFGSEGASLLGTVTARNVLKDMFTKVSDGGEPQAALEDATAEVERIVADAG